eukprot:5020373-Amphidinium_carterae.1
MSFCRKSQFAACLNNMRKLWATSSPSLDDKHEDIAAWEIQVQNMVNRVVNSWGPPQTWRQSCLGVDAEQVGFSRLKVPLSWIRGAATQLHIGCPLAAYPSKG